MSTKNTDKKDSIPSRTDKSAFLDSLLSGEEDNKPATTTTPPKIDKKQPKTEERESRSKISNIRKVISSRLLEVQKNSAMLTTFNEVDMTNVLELHKKYNAVFQEQHGVKLSLMSFFVKAAVSAMQSFPLINSYIDGDEIVTREYYDIGIAVGSERGLMVPVLKGCEELSFADIENNIKKFAEKVDAGKIDVEDLQGGCFTITNGAIYGSTLSIPFLNPPQSAILGMHKIEKRAVVINDEIVARDMMYLALTYDHCVIDGKEAVSFLTHIKKVIEDSSRLLLDVTF